MQIQGGRMEINMLSALFFQSETCEITLLWAQSGVRLISCPKADMAERIRKNVRENWQR